MWYESWFFFFFFIFFNALNFVIVAYFHLLDKMKNEENIYNGPFSLKNLVLILYFVSLKVSDFALLISEKKNSRLLGFKLLISEIK